jgi:hypothetical protein
MARVWHAFQVMLQSTCQTTFVEFNEEQKRYAKE